MLLSVQTAASIMATAPVRTATRTALLHEPLTHPVLRVRPSLILSESTGWTAEGPGFEFLLGQDLSLLRSIQPLYNGPEGGIPKG
jgi:hypothetical protein